jgi:hypothetical protein
MKQAQGARYTAHGPMMTSEILSLSLEPYALSQFHKSTFIHKETGIFKPAVSE